MRCAPILLCFVLTGCVTVGGAPLVPGASAPVTASSRVGIAGDGVAGPALKTLSRGDRARALAAEYQALEFQAVGEPIEWRGERGAGSASALAPFRVGSQNCRQLIHRLEIGGETRTERGSACREPNGTWTPLT